MQKSLVVASAVAYSIVGVVGNKARAQTFTLGEDVRIVPNATPKIDNYPYIPDGHMPYFPSAGSFHMFWPGSVSCRTQGRDMFHMESTEQVLRGGPAGSFDNGGAWLYSVFPRTPADYLGFYHAEDHEFSGDPQSRFIAWKSIAQATSNDGGRTWSKGGQIITSAQAKPQRPAWGGNGDFCVVRDGKKDRWVCFYQEGQLCMAVSSDPEGKPGTWFKFYKGKFQEPGLGGRNSPIPALAGLPGGNPSVHFNTFLKKWVMVWHTWFGTPIRPDGLWISTSEDLEDWTNPKILIAAERNERVWYPTIIGSTDLEAGQTAQLCYAWFPDKGRNEREFRVRPITFEAEK